MRVLAEIYNTCLGGGRECVARSTLYKMEQSAKGITSVLSDNIGITSVLSDNIGITVCSLII